MIRPWMIYTLLVVLYSSGVWFSGYQTSNKAWTIRDTERQLADAKGANAEWAERFTLEAQLATRDQQLAESQLAAKSTRAETVIKLEVVYRDRIKNVVVRDCVANSGLLDYYDATLGLSGPTE